MVSTREGKSAPEVARRLGFGDHRGQFSQWDDGSTAWELDFEPNEDDWQFEAVQRAEEKDEGLDFKSFGFPVDETYEDFIEKGFNARQALIARVSYSFTSKNELIDKNRKCADSSTGIGKQLGRNTSSPSFENFML